MKPVALTHVTGDIHTGEQQEKFNELLHETWEMLYFMAPCLLIISLKKKKKRLGY